MNNEKGVTLIELLISVVIAGMAIIPLLLIMTGSFTRTTEQGRDTQLIYFGQQVMEEIRQNGFTGSTQNYDCSTTQGCNMPGTLGDLIDATVKVVGQEYTQENITQSYSEIQVIVTSEIDSNDQIELFTVVRNGE
ncbi:type IV pilus modification PilV family protein [Robertmurraya sp. GLU-23]